jgi:hypothetical protein
MLSPRDALTGFKYYYYEPSMAAAVLFTILFALSTGLHFAQMLKSRTWFMIPFVIGGVCEFAARYPRYPMYPTPKSR